ncbi:proliferating cell nuclear antigen family protein [Heterostelium album PN500]|uniref:Proliferating cell nuclear antigen family protein n=1 Tax=Heterostelium pallidum (strain ATCC 26659 / Pp 5 / PN500) TaxID=670386 RepID=D3BIN4_HETP5|nr:proliferating cell nuclear antigen family protein [Heterostelium album PN500]EFA78658.1 proliferating cell nuclear antigen family protein [Heterostelium album PN500]|eukprot:XP_020430782.1 proliferating cell nuclear antigen family protein [Heterostelium album PN500]
MKVWKKASDKLVKSSITLYNNKTKDFFIIGKSVFDIEFKNSYFLKLDKVLKKLSVKECLLQFGQDLPLSMILYVNI